MNQIQQASEVVMLTGEQVVTDSRKVAEHFGKRHADVLRSIRALIKKLPEGGLRNFAHTPSIDSSNGETYDLYQMTKDGFMLLAMGFTGDKALQVKLDFIAAFNEMAEFIRTQAYGAWRQYEAAQLEYRHGKDYASRCGAGLAEWKKDKLVHIARLERLDPQIKLPLYIEKAA